MTRRHIRILIADDSAPVRDAIAALLQDADDLDLVGLAEDAAGAIAIALAHQPDVALVDVRMPGGGPAATTGILAVSPSTTVIAHSAIEGRDAVLQMLAAGARGYIVKGGAGRDLIDAIRRGAGGGMRLSDPVSAIVVDELRSKIDSLAEAQSVARLGTWSWDTEGGLTLSDEACAMLGSDPHPREPISVREILALIDPVDRDLLIGILGSPAGDDPGECECRIVRTDGDVRWTLIRARVAAKRDGVTRIAGTILDITERKQAEIALSTSETKFRSLFANMPVPMWVYAIESLRFLEVNEAACANYGYSRDEFLSMSIADIRPPEDVPRLLADEATAHPPLRTRKGWRHTLRDGRLIDVELRVHDLDWDGTPATMVLVQDVTEQLHIDAQLRQQAFYDALTGLPNRALCKERLQVALDASRSGESGCALLFLNLNDFKSIIDSVGYEIGDSVLVAVANSLREAMRPGDTVARFGGDEFAVVAEDVVSNDDAIGIVHRLLRAFDAPISAAGRLWRVGTSVGVVLTLSSDIPATADMVFRNADLAMNEAKRQGSGTYAIFQPEMHAAILERLAIHEDLREAISHDRLTLVFQPQYDLRQGSMTGMEVLTRWKHPSRGWVPPSQFIPVAEASELVVALDEWVLQTAVAQLRCWGLAAGATTIAINLSAKTLARNGLAERYGAIVESAGVQAVQIEFEVTETAGVETAGALANLTALRAQGFGITIDDFGVGYSMLSRLQDFPVDKIKIDQSFIHRIQDADDDAPLVAAIIAMAHSLDMTVVAEGVETPHQLDFLRRHGSDLAQGYLLGKPLTATDIEPLIAVASPLLAAPLVPFLAL